MGSSGVNLSRTFDDSFEIRQEEQIDFENLLSRRANWPPSLDDFCVQNYVLMLSVCLKRLVCLDNLSFSSAKMAISAIEWARHFKHTMIDTFDSGRSRFGQKRDGGEGGGGGGGLDRRLTKALSC